MTALPSKLRPAAETILAAVGVPAGPGSRLTVGDLDRYDALREAGIKTFVYTNQSTAVMENLHALAAQGCTMLGLCTITRQETRWGDEEPSEIMGIRFQLN